MLASGRIRIATTTCATASAIAASSRSLTRRAYSSATDICVRHAGMLLWLNRTSIRLLIGSSLRLSWIVIAASDPGIHHVQRDTLLLVAQVVEDQSPARLKCPAANEVGDVHVGFIANPREVFPLLLVHHQRKQLRALTTLNGNAAGSIGVFSW